VVAGKGWERVEGSQDPAVRSVVAHEVDWFEALLDSTTGWVAAWSGDTSSRRADRRQVGRPRRLWVCGTHLFRS
jgi:hypothetical protein